MKQIIIIAFCLLCISTQAQKRIIFSSQNYVGLLEGEQGSAFQLQTINGIKYKGWFVGVGTGLDWYYRRSIPAFVSLNKDLFKKGHRSFFVVADAGANFPWRDDKNYNLWGYTTEKSLPGLYWSGGLGYKIGMGRGNDALLLQVAFSYKHIQEKATNIYYYPIVMIAPPTQEEATNRFDYYLRRLSVKLGWNF